VDFDFFLKVVKHNLKYAGEYTHMNVEFGGLNAILEKKTENRISIRSQGASLFIESSQDLLGRCEDEIFENNINLSNFTRVVVVRDIVCDDSPGLTELTAIVELLFTYFHMILAEENNDSPILKISRAMRMDNIEIEDKVYMVLCDPGSIV